MEGLSLLKEYITEEQEKFILSKIRSNKQRPYVSRNTITRYGSRVPYNGPIQSATLPPHLQEICQKLLDDNLVEELPDSITINEYFPGQHISYHIDSPGSGPVITVLSLLSDVKMNLKKGNEVIEIELPRRSLLQMKGESRYDWQHATQPAQDRRFSLVFRKGTIINNG